MPAAAPCGVLIEYGTAYLAPALQGRLPRLYCKGKGTVPVTPPESGVIAGQLRGGLLEGR